MRNLSLRFIEPFAVDVQERPVPEPPEDGVLVETRISAISSGTEMLAFKGCFPENMAVDETLSSLPRSNFQYPAQYGYSCVGTVTAAGARIDPDWIGRPVFAFHPHESHFTVHPSALIPIPEGISSEDAVFLASMETAVNLVMDGRPIVGEQVIVVGQGIVGLLTSALLARHPLDLLICIDRLSLRREAALTVGADLVLSGSESDMAALLDQQPTAKTWSGKADLIYELTGNPQALNLALEWCGFDSRIVIGSWYGKNTANLDLGGRFHRDRVRIVSSQVSTIAPEYTGRWTQARRMDVAMEMLKILRPSRFISHRFHVREAQSAYDQIARRPGDALQVILVYSDAERTEI